MNGQAYVRWDVPAYNPPSLVTADMEITDLFNHLYAMARIHHRRELRILVTSIYLDQEKEEHVLNLPGCKIEVYPY